MVMILEVCELGLPAKFGPKYHTRKIANIEKDF